MYEETRVKKIVEWLVVCITCSSAVLGTFYSRLFFVGWIRMLLSLIGAGIWCVGGIYSEESLRLKKSDLLMGLMILFILSDRSGDYEELVIYISYFWVVLFGRNQHGWIDKSINLLLAFTWFYIAMTYICYFFDDFYLGYVVNLFPNTRQRLIEQYSNGCIAGFTEHYSTNGMFVACGVLLSGGRILKPEVSKKKWMVLTMVGIVALLLTGKRAHILFTVFVLCFLYFLYQLKQKEIMKSIGKLSILVSGISVTGWLLYLYVPQLATFILRFQETIANGDVTLGRDIFWGKALELFARSPVRGYRWGYFLETSVELIGIRAHCHNSYIEILCDLGIFGFGVFISWFLYLFLSTAVFFVRCMKGQIICTKNCRYHMGLSVGFQVFFLIYAFTGNPIYDVEIFGPYFIMCGVSLYYQTKVRKVTILQTQTAIQSKVRKDENKYEK